MPYHRGDRVHHVSVIRSCRIRSGDCPIPTCFGRAFQSRGDSVVLPLRKSWAEPRADAYRGAGSCRRDRVGRPFHDKGLENGKQTLNVNVFH